MQLVCDQSVALDLRSSLQKVRRISEEWFTNEAYCLRCESAQLTGTTSSTQFRDAVCPVCCLGYELKSKVNRFSTLVADGGFDSMLRNIVSDNAPVLTLLNYRRDWVVTDLVAIHPVFLTPSMVVRRKKAHLRPKSGKPYWMCNLDLSRIPQLGRIPVVDCGKICDAAVVRKSFARLTALGALPFRLRGWAGATLDIVNKLGAKSFKTSEIYKHAGELQKTYPNNRNIEAKLRQQLQVLVKLGYLERTCRGSYQLLRSDALRT